MTCVFFWCIQPTFGVPCFAGSLVRYLDQPYYFILEVVIYQFRSSFLCKINKVEDKLYSSVTEVIRFVIVVRFFSGL